MIKWKGQPTNRKITWRATAETYKELYFKLIDMNIISFVDGFPDEIFLLNKVGLKLNDFDNVEEKWNYDFQKWFEEVTRNVELTEDDYKIIIESEKGDAYYQELEVTQ